MQPTHIINEHCTKNKSFFIYDLGRVLQHYYNLEFKSDDLILTAIAAYTYEIALGKKDEEIDKNLIRVVNKYVKDTTCLLPLFEKYSAEDIACALLQTNKPIFKDTNLLCKDSILALVDKFLDIKDDEIVCDLNTNSFALLQDLSLKYTNTKFFTSNISNLLNTIFNIKTKILNSNMYTDGKDFLDFYHIHSQDKFDKVFYYAQNTYFSSYDRRDGSLCNFAKLSSTLDFERNISPTIKNLHLAMHMLKDTGKVVALIPTSNLLKADDKTSNFKSLIDKNYVEAVISLANEFFNGGRTLYKSSMSLVILSHNNDKVRLLDLSDKAKINIESIYNALYKDDLKCTCVDLETIKNNNYIVHPLYYTLDNKDCSYAVSLKDLVKNDFVIEQNDEKEALRAKRLTFRLLSTFCNNDKIENKHILSSFDLHTMSFDLNRFKYDIKDQVSFKEHCLSIDKDMVNPLYLKAFFKSDIGYNSILKAMFKSHNFILDSDNLLNIEVLLPPMSLQNEIAEHYKDTISKIDSLNKELDKTIESVYSICKNLN